MGWRLLDYGLCWRCRAGEDMKGTAVLSYTGKDRSEWVREEKE